MPLLKQFNFAAKLYAKLADSLRLFETLAKNYFVSHSKATGCGHSLIIFGLNCKLVPCGTQTVQFSSQRFHSFREQLQRLLKTQAMNYSVSHDKVAGYGHGMRHMPGRVWRVGA